MFEVGVAEVDITPEVGYPLAGFSARKSPSKGIDTRLYSRALILKNGKDIVCINSNDLCYVPAKIVETLRSRIQETFSLSEDKVMVCATHTHSGPVLDSRYTSCLENKVLEAISKALANTKLASIGSGKGTVNNLFTNRRKPNGAVDPGVSVVKVVDISSNGIMALLVNLSCHPTVLGPDNLLISSDYPGYISYYLEEFIGEKPVVIFLNGAFGDVNPFTSKGYTGTLGKGGSVEDTRKIGKIIALEVLKIIERIETTDDVGLKSLLEKIEIKQTSNLTLVEKAERLLNEKRLETSNKIRAGDKERTGLECLYYEEMLDVVRRTGTMLEEDEEINLQVIEIDDTILVGISGEPFVSIGLQVKKLLLELDFENVLVIGCANGYSGYIPDTDSQREGGYEPYAAKLGGMKEPNADRIIVENIYGLVKKLGIPEKKSKAKRSETDYVLWHIPGKGDWQIPLDRIV